MILLYLSYSFKTVQHKSILFFPVFFFVLFLSSRISCGDTFSLRVVAHLPLFPPHTHPTPIPPFLFYVNKSLGACGRQRLICQLWLLTSVTSAGWLLLSKLKNRVIWISWGECNILQQGKSVAFPIFLCRDKTVFSGLPTELMRTKRFRQIIPSFSNFPQLF